MTKMQPINTDVTEQETPNRVFHAFSLASNLRQLLLTEEQLSHLDIQPIENLLDSLEALAIRLTKADMSTHENTPCAEIQT